MIWARICGLAWRPAAQAKGVTTTIEAERTTRNTSITAATRGRRVAPQQQHRRTDGHRDDPRQVEDPRRVGQVRQVNVRGIPLGQTPTISLSQSTPVPIPPAISSPAAPAAAHAGRPATSPRRRGVSGHQGWRSRRGRGSPRRRGRSGSAAHRTTGGRSSRSARERCRWSADDRSGSQPWPACSTTAAPAPGGGVTASCARQVCRVKRRPCDRHPRRPTRTPLRR